MSPSWAAAINVINASSVHHVLFFFFLFEAVILKILNKQENYSLLIENIFQACWLVLSKPSHLSAFYSCSLSIFFTLTGGAVSSQMFNVPVLICVTLSEISAPLFTMTPPLLPTPTPLSQVDQLTAPLTAHVPHCSQFALKADLIKTIPPPSPFFCYSLSWLPGGAADLPAEGEGRLVQ